MEPSWGCTGALRGRRRRRRCYDTGRTVKFVPMLEHHRLRSSFMKLDSHTLHLWLDQDRWNYGRFVTTIAHGMKQLRKPSSGSTSTQQATMLGCPLQSWQLDPLHWEGARPLEAMDQEGESAQHQARSNIQPQSTLARRLHHGGETIRTMCTGRNLSAIWWGRSSWRTRMSSMQKSLQN